MPATDRPLPFDAIPPEAALSLLNSINWRLSAAPVELLTPASLPEALQAQGIGEALPAQLSPALLDELRALRAELWPWVEAVVAGTALPARLEAALQRRWVTARTQLVLLPAQARAALRLRGPADLPALFLLATLRLLQRQAAQPAKVCADARGCGWLFVDDTRNRARRFCSDTCATYARQQRYLARSR